MRLRAAAARHAGPHPTRRCASLLAILAAAVLLGPRPADAHRIFVPRQHRTVQGAIDAASPGDTIWVAAGVYRGPIRITKNLVVFGEGGPDSTILDGGDSVRVVHVEGVTAGHLLGFTIRGGKAPGGGGIYCLNDSAFSISTCRIEKNWESGVALWRSAGMALLDLEVRENKGSGITLSFSSTFLLRCRLIGNTAPSGGGVSLEHSKVAGSVRDCTFDANRAEAGTGGGLFADSSDVTLSRCRFTGNHASVAGGAVSLMGATEGQVLSSFFQENRAASAPAVNIDHSLVHVSSCIFDRNRSTAGSAAVQVLGRGVANVTSNNKAMDGMERIIREAPRRQTRADASAARRTFEPRALS